MSPEEAPQGLAQPQGDFLVQIGGVEKYDGETLAYKSVFSASRWLWEPEGLTFHNHAMFVARSAFLLVQ